MNLTGKNVVITGASMGLGRAIAEAFVQARSHLLLCARTEEPLRLAAEELKTRAAPEQKILWKLCDVSNPAQIGELASFALKEMGGCDVLVNNAAIHGPKGPLDEVPWDEWREAIEVNLYGVALPCRAFIPQMKKKGRGKIINLSGGGATGPRPFFSAYAAAKSAVVRLTETLAEEVLPCPIDINAVAPGAMKTRLLTDAFSAGPEKIGAKAYADLLRIRDGGGDSPAEAAGLVLFLSGPESDGITGRLISAPWDPWKNLSEHRAELAAGDIYTLRRIVPQDRGKNWDPPT
jgi:3-oxoacyl-[acyl-carrier protein] reductase